MTSNRHALMNEYLRHAYSALPVLFALASSVKAPDGNPTTNVLQLHNNIATALNELDSCVDYEQELEDKNERLAAENKNLREDFVALNSLKHDRLVELNNSNTLLFNQNKALAEEVERYKNALGYEIKKNYALKQQLDEAYKTCNQLSHEKVCAGLPMSTVADPVSWTDKLNAMARGQAICVASPTVTVCPSIHKDSEYWRNLNQIYYSWGWMLGAIDGLMDEPEARKRAQDHNKHVLDALRMLRGV